MEGNSAGEEGWYDDEDEDKDEYEDNGDDEGEDKSEKAKGGSREGKWESGKGRCAITGRRVLGGTDGLRRVMA